MDTNIILTFIDEISKDHDKFIQNRIKVDPINKEQLAGLLGGLGLDLNPSHALTILKFHAKQQNRILDENYATSLLSHENMHEIIRNKRILFDRRSETEKARLLTRLTSLNANQIKDLVVAIKKSPLKEKRSSSSDDITFSILSILRRHGDPMSRGEIAQKLNLDKSETTMSRLSRTLELMANKGDVKTIGVRASRRYLMPSRRQVA